MKYIIAILFLFISTVSFSQLGMLLVDKTDPPVPNLLLNDYPGAAVAYSVHKLDKDYTGSCLRVRRDSDNAEQDIGFSGNDLDEASLTSFCSGANCFVKTWYDQSGNSNNATQTITERQPKIYDSSTGITYNNSIATITFLGINRASLISQLDISSSNSDYSFFWVVNHGFSTTQRLLDNKVGIFAGNAGRFIIHAYGGGGAYLLNGTNYGTEFGAGTTALKTYLFIAPNSNIYLNSSFNQSSIYSQIRLPTGTTISSSDNGYEIDGSAQLILIYNSDQSANRTAIETIINNYFSIY